MVCLLCLGRLLFVLWLFRLLLLWCFGSLRLCSFDFACCLSRVRVVYVVYVVLRWVYVLAVCGAFGCLLVFVFGVLLRLGMCLCWFGCCLWLPWLLIVELLVAADLF